MKTKKLKYNFQDYPEPDPDFPDKEAKKAALEATLRFYSAYDMESGDAYLLREVDGNE